MKFADVDRIRRALSAVDYPASKEDLVAQVKQQHPDDPEVIRLLRALPLGEYANTDEVIRSVRLDAAAGEERTEADHALQAREARKRPLVAEHLREVPESPIEKGHEEAGPGPAGPRVPRPDAPGWERG